MKIAVIPARGGSKRIPRKNIKVFAGKPMIAWSIDAAQKSNLFAEIIVSTDDEEIAAIARQYGASVPFIRPDKLSDDHCGTIEVIAHATRWACSKFDNIEAVCCIYATAPFVQAQDIRESQKLMENEEWAYSFTVTEYPSPIFRSFTQSENGGIEMFYPEHFTSRSQDLPIAYHDAAQFYWGKSGSWLNGLPIFSSHSAPLVIPRWRVQDIDDENDWIRAEIMYQSLIRQRLIGV